MWYWSRPLFPDINVNTEQVNSLRGPCVCILEQRLWHVSLLKVRTAALSSHWWTHVVPPERVCLCACSPQNICSPTALTALIWHHPRLDRTTQFPLRGQMAACSLLHTPSSSLLPFLSLTGAASAIPVQPPAPQVSPQARALPLTVDQPLVASLVPPVKRQIVRQPELLWIQPWGLGLRKIG